MTVNVDLCIYWLLYSFSCVSLFLFIVLLQVITIDIIFTSGLEVPRYSIYDVL
jgi:hypothetical protein